MLAATALKYFASLFEPFYNPKGECGTKLRNTDSKDQEQYSKTAAICLPALILPLTFCKALGRSVSHPLPYPSPFGKTKLIHLQSWIEWKEGQDKT